MIYALSRDTVICCFANVVYALSREENTAGKRLEKQKRRGILQFLVFYLWLGAFLLAPRGAYRIEDNSTHLPGISQNPRGFYIAAVDLGHTARSEGFSVLVKERELFKVDYVVALLGIALGEDSHFSDYRSACLLNEVFE